MFGSCLLYEFVCQWLINPRVSNEIRFECDNQCYVSVFIRENGDRGRRTVERMCLLVNKMRSSSDGPQGELASEHNPGSCLYPERWSASLQSHQCYRPWQCGHERREPKATVGTGWWSFFIIIQCQSRYIVTRPPKHNLLHILISFNCKSNQIYPKTLLIYTAQYIF